MFLILATDAVSIPIGTPKDWAAAGGLAGLVIFALFVVLVTFFIFAFRHFRLILNDSKSDRIRWEARTDKEREATVKALKAITEATYSAMDEHRTSMQRIREEIAGASDAQKRAIEDLSKYLKTTS